MTDDAKVREQNPEWELLAIKYRESDKGADGKPEGTLKSLKRCASMLNTYAPDCFPANENGQVHFVRAMMESVADEIDAYLAEHAPPATPFDAEKPSRADLIAANKRLCEALRMANDKVAFGKGNIHDVFKHCQATLAECEVTP